MQELSEVSFLEPLTQVMFVQNVSTDMICYCSQRLSAEQVTVATWTVPDPADIHLRHSAA